MIALRFTFGTGRYHATRWDLHRNGGGEWPPSPWRILRALAYVAHNSPSLDGPGRERALATLRRLDVPPAFGLPATTLGTSATYAPLHNGGTTLVHDRFHVLGGPFFVAWPVDLSAEERATIAQLAAGVSYLGRAESWCEVEVVNDPPLNAEPTLLRDEGADVVSVLCPAPGFTVEELSRTANEIVALRSTVPPGAKWVAYRLPRHAPVRAQKATWEKFHTVAELALGGSVLPRVSDTVDFAGLVRRASMSLCRRPSPTFSGHAADDTPLQTQHQHAHFLPEARGRDGRRITHVMVWAPGGLGAEEQRALRRLVRLARHPGDDHPVSVVLTGVGQPADFSGGSRLFGRAAAWRTSTPFRAGHRVRDIAERVRREIGWRNMPAPADVSVQKGGDVTIRWDVPVEGPVVLGYHCHYGMGQFQPAE